MQSMTAENLIKIKAWVINYILPFIDRLYQKQFIFHKCFDYKASTTWKFTWFWHWSESGWVSSLFPARDPGVPNQEVISTTFIAWNTHHPHWVLTEHCTWELPVAVGTHYPTWWFNQTAIHFLTFPEARSPRHQQYPSPPSEGSRGDSLLDSSGPTCPWLWLGAHSTSLSASIFTFPSPLGLCSPLLRAREDKQANTNSCHRPLPAIPHWTQCNKSPFEQIPPRGKDWGFD